MDLGTIKKRLEHGWYQTSKECVDDINSMFSNCYIYNKPDEDIVHMAKEIEQAFLEKLAKMPSEVRPLHTHRVPINILSLTELRNSCL